MANRIRVNGRLYEAVGYRGEAPELTPEQKREIQDLREDAAYIHSYLKHYGANLQKVKKWLKPGDIRTYDGGDDLLDTIDVDAFGISMTFDHIEEVLYRLESDS